MDWRDARRLGAALRSGLRGVRAAPLVFVASVATMAAGLLLLVSYLLVVHNMRDALDHFGRGVVLVAFLGADAVGTPEQVARLEAEIGGLDGVAEVHYRSAREALERLRIDLGAEADVLEGLPRNPLPASFEVGVLPRMRPPDRLRELAGRLEATPGVDEVRYGEDWAAGYARVLSILEWVGAALGAFLLLVLGAIVAGTTRLAVHARADEIEIQRLVGAGGLIVRLPFYLEGGLQGVTAAAIALAALYTMFRLGLPLVRGPLEFLLGRTELVFFGPAELLAVFGVAIGLGVSGAVVSLLRLGENS